MIWTSIKRVPDNLETGIYVVAAFDKSGKLLGYSTDYVYIEESKEFIPNSSESYRNIRCEPTHYMTKEQFMLLIQECPRIEEDGTLIIGSD